MDKTQLEELAQLRQQALQWERWRRALNDREIAHMNGEGDHPTPSEWEDSDDDASEIVHRFLEITKPKGV